MKTFTYLAHVLIPCIMVVYFLECIRFHGQLVVSCLLLYFLTCLRIRKVMFYATIPAAANDLFRCLTCTGATTIGAPFITTFGIGWTAMFIAGLWVSWSPAWWAVFSLAMLEAEADRQVLVRRNSIKFGTTLFPLSMRFCNLEGRRHRDFRQRIPERQSFFDTTIQLKDNKLGHRVRRSLTPGHTSRVTDSREGW